MKFLLDENFPVSVADILAEAGHEPIAFADVCDYGADDEVVFAVAQRLGAIILTSDRDFYHTMPLLHPHHHGIVVVALRQPNRRAIVERVQWLLTRIDAPFADKVIILRDFSCRVRIARSS